MNSLGVVTLTSPQKITVPSSCVLFTTAIQGQTNSGNMGSIPVQTGDSLASTTPRKVAPAPQPSRAKRRPGLVHVQTQPVSVSRRNARERNRVRQVNNGFAALRQHLPSGSKSKKMSKVETLRRAVDYIRNLQHMVAEHDGSPEADLHHHHQQQQQHQFYSSSNAENISPSSSGHLLSSLSPTGSDDALSPSPSYTSESSSPSSQPHSAGYDATHQPSFDKFDTYDAMSPEDEELLDVISWWQQSQ